ncbi:hypothetical protein [Veillonella sp.]|uniref:hypothetical protein n=1 Tax=Veillonella sp. TaxID=1926307 RepID=UPI002901B7B4|nr:hypothetical protein [Veillonella sp.]MDU2155139.1 hypothetical protein [Veillonella sp.]
MFTEHDYDPDDDLLPFGTDFKGDDIEAGEEDVVQIDGEYVRLDDATEWLVANSSPVNTEVV